MKHSIKGIQLTLGLAALWFAPAAANAQVTITSVKVTVSSATSTAIYCSTSLHCAGVAPGNGNVEVWDLGVSGVTLAGGQTLVLAQTALIANLPGGNFDTSDRIRIPTGTSVGPFEKDCTTTDHCNVAIEINGVQVYNSAAPVALNAFNNDTTSPEGSPWAPVVLSPAQPNYSLALGYADNEHGVSFFPSPFADATVFKGAGINAALGTCTTNCYDSGALLITGIRVSNFSGCTVTQGGWGSTPHGNNPGAFLAAHFPVGGETIGGSPFFLSFSTAASVKNFLPQGGTPGALTSSASNPTAGTSAGVFAGQVLALQLNVDLEGFGSLVLSGTGTSLDGKTVAQVLAAANLALAGGALPAGFTYSSLNDLVDNLNNAFDGCVATAWATAHLH
jgi:hypothetical protein